jgi:hypothetical protein
MKVRTQFAVAALSMAAWAVPAWATPPSQVYFDRSPRQADPWSDRTDPGGDVVYQQRPGPHGRGGPGEHGPGGHGPGASGGRAAAKEADDDSDDKQIIKDLAKQVKELTRQVKELSEKLDEEKAPAHSGQESGSRSTERGHAPEDGDQGWSGHQMPRHQMGPGGRGRMGPMDGRMGRGGPSGGHGMMGWGPRGHRSMGLGQEGRGDPDGRGDDGDGQAGRREMGRGPGGPPSWAARDGERPGSTTGRRTLTARDGRQAQDGHAEPATPKRKSEATDGDSGPKLPDGFKLPDGMKLKSGDEVIIIRIGGDEAGKAEPKVRAKVKIDQNSEKEDDSDEKAPQGEHGRLRHQSRDDG